MTIEIKNFVLEVRLVISNLIMNQKKEEKEKNHASLSFQSSSRITFIKIPIVSSMDQQNIHIFNNFLKSRMRQGVTNKSTICWPIILLAKYVSLSTKHTNYSLEKKLTFVASTSLRFSSSKRSSVKLFSISSLTSGSHFTQSACRNEDNLIRIWSNELLQCHQTWKSCPMFYIITCLPFYHN